MERPDRPLVPLKAGHPRTPMPHSQAGSGTSMRSPDIMMVQLQPRIPPLAPSWTPVDPISWQAASPPLREWALTTPEATTGSDLHPGPRSLYVPVPYRPRRIT